MIFKCMRGDSLDAAVDKTVALLNKIKCFYLVEAPSKLALGGSIICRLLIRFCKIKIRPKLSLIVAIAYLT